MWIGVYNQNGVKSHLNLDRVQMLRIEEPAELLRIGDAWVKVNKIVWDDELESHTDYIRQELAKRLKTLLKEVEEDV